MQYVFGELQNKIKRKEPKQKATKRNDTEENLTARTKNKKLVKTMQTVRTLNGYNPNVIILFISSFFLLFFNLLDQPTKLIFFGL